MIKTSTRLAIAACLLLLLTHCQKQETHSTSSLERLNVNLSEDPASLDPRSVRSLKDLTVVKQLFEGLTRLDETGTPKAALAETIELSEDALTYTFALREAYWTNGEKVTAQDFIYAWGHVLDPSFACDYSHMLYPIKNAQAARKKQVPLSDVGIQALDDKTLIVTLENPTPYFLELTAFPTFFPVPSKVDPVDPRWSLPTGKLFVCNGPFRLKTWAPESSLILEKNPTYWDADQVHLSEIAFTVIKDNTTESLLFEKGDLDWLGQPISHNIPPELLGKMRLEGKISSYPVAGTFWFKFNTECKPFNNSNIRKAFSLAIVRKDVISHLLQGHQQVATGPLPPCMALQQAPYFQDGDNIAAKALFEEGMRQEGWTRDTFPSISLNYPPSERNNKIVQLVQQQWQTAFGIPIILDAVEGHVYRRLLRQGLFQVGTGEWIADFNDPLAFLELFKYRNDPKTGSGMNDTGWQNTAYIGLIDQATHEKDFEKRKALLHEAEKLLVEAMPIAPVYHYAFDYAKKQSIQNVILSPLGIADFKKATFSPCEDACR